jgi:hypothetical protein
MKRPALCWLLAFAPGCVVTHWDLNAPGHIDVATPPRAIETRQTETPEDPGERLLVVSAGPFAAGGISFGTDSGLQTSGTLGAELSVQMGTEQTSHRDDFLLYPEKALGMNVGWVAPTGLRATSALYFEGQVWYRPVGLAGGWLIAPGGPSRDQGPQLTGFVGPFFLRGNVSLAGQVSIQLGVILKFAGVWVWSQ